LTWADTPTPAAAPLPNAAVEKLIDQLVDVDSPTVGANTNSTAVNIFIGGNSPAVILTGPTKQPLPPTPPVMRQIVELGVAAVPSLLDHLTDARDTKLKIRNPGLPVVAPGTPPPMGSFGSITYNDEYDPRYRYDPARTPTKVNLFGQIAIFGSGPGDYYTVRTGDLCYVLLGQIVGRTLHVVRYQPTACAEVNSPLQNPALAEAARQDWGNLTLEQHRNSLIEDATGDAIHGLQFVRFGNQHQDAFDRLAFYYPEAAKATAVKFLAYPIAEWHYQRVTDFTAKYLAEPNAATRAALLTTAQKQWGNPFILAVTDPMRRLTAETPPTPIDAAGTLPPTWTLSGNLLSHRTSTPSVGGVSSSSTSRIYPQPQWDRATEMLKAVDAQGWVASLKGHQPVYLSEQIAIIKALENIADPALDAACVDLFRRALALRDPTEPAAIDATLGQLADACVARLLKNPGADQKVVDEIVGSKAKFHPPAPSSALP